jgi:hypothetical protein
VKDAGLAVRAVSPKQDGSAEGLRAIDGSDIELDTCGKLAEVKEILNLEQGDAAAAAS